MKTHRSYFCLVLAVLAVTAMLAIPASSAIIRVKWDSPTDGPGNDWAHAYHTVTAGIAASVSGDEIWVAGDSAPPYVERITLKNGVGLYGGFIGTETARAQRDWKANVTILDGNWGGDVVTAPSGVTASTVLDGFTVTNGAGNGVFCDSSSPSISNNTIWRNRRSGIYCNNSSAPLINNNTISESTEEGVVCSASSPTITNNTISNNGNSAGIVCQGASSPSIANNTISHRNGSAIRCDSTYPSSPRIANNIISGSTVGVSCSYSPAAITNNTITGNENAGIVCTGGAPLVANNTLSDNNSGISCHGNTSPSIVNNIVAFSFRGIYIESGSGAPVLTSNCVYNPAGTDYEGVVAGAGDLSVDPLFVSKASGDFHLKSQSPCVDSGLDSAVLAAWKDMDARPRIYGAHVDIGADEYEPPSIPEVLDDGLYTTALTQLHATWSCTDPGSGIAEYTYAIGTTPSDTGSGYVVAWKSAGTVVEATETGLSLVPGVTYYWYVRAKNGAGRWSDSAGPSDGIVAALPLARLAGAKYLSVSSAVMLQGLVASTSSADFAGFVFMQEPGRATGMRVNTSATMNRGDVLSLAGRVKRVDGEWQIDVLEPPSVVSGGAPKPLFMTQRSLASDPNEDLTPESGVDATGLLVTIAGTVTRINTTYHVIYVNDGSELADGMGPSDSPYVGVRVGYRAFIPPAVNKRVKITGVLRVEKATLAEDAFVNGEYRLAGETLYLPLVCPRTQADIVVQ